MSLIAEMFLLNLLGKFAIVRLAVIDHKDADFPGLEKVENLKLTQNAFLELIPDTDSVILKG